jgi:hypothetical protein
LVAHIEEESRLGLFENRALKLILSGVLKVILNGVLKVIFGSKMKEIKGEWRKLHNKQLNVPQAYGSYYTVRVITYPFPHN